MRRKIITVTMEVLVPEDDQSPEDKSLYFGGFVAGLIQAFSRMVVRTHAVTILDLGNEGG